jgi:hypothetical protein
VVVELADPATTVRRPLPPHAAGRHARLQQLQVFRPVRLNAQLSRAHTCSCGCACVLLPERPDGEGDNQHEAAGSERKLGGQGDVDHVRKVRAGPRTQSYVTRLRRSRGRAKFLGADHRQQLELVIDLRRGVLQPVEHAHEAGVDVLQAQLAGRRGVPGQAEQVIAAGSVASPPGRQAVVYGFGRIDPSGRVADRSTIAALGWRGGDRLTLTADAGVMLGGTSWRSSGRSPSAGYFKIPYPERTGVPHPAMLDLPDRLAFL